MKIKIPKQVRKITLITSILFSVLSSAVFANNIAVTNSSIVGQNTALHYSNIKFDISWENSWRTSTLEKNWDAAYVFVKYRIPPLNTWHHATLNYVDGSAVNDGNVEPSGATINTTTDGKGAYIYKNANGIGNNNFTNAQLRWNYGADGLTDEDSVEICVFSIEMVYVPQASFYVGDGTTTTIQGQFEDGTSGNPLQITSENALTLGGGGVGSLGNNNKTGVPAYEDFSDATTKSLPTNFPKGFDAFYCMKYEITQGQYADFLNKLSLAQATPRYIAAYNTLTQSITGTHPNFTADAPDRPLMNVNYVDFYSFLDWCALRPMTELEYEKANRGTRYPTPNEYAWGDLSIHNSLYTITDAGLPSETINAVSTIGNASYISTNNIRPYRAGAISASQVSPNRVEAGATYYGIMEMSGNQFEFALTVGSPESRLFDGSNGDGYLNGSGVYDVANWPSTVFGLGTRGGAYNSAATILRTSSRIYASYYLPNNAGYTQRYLTLGGRGVRSAQ